MHEARFHCRIIVLHLGLAGLVAAGCATKSPVKAEPEDVVGIKRGNEVRLINEGGPVFAMPGQVLFLASARATEDPKVTAERGDGTKIQSVPSALIGADGTFLLRGAMSAGVFFATTVVEDNDSVYRMRALVRPENDKSITIDTVSSLVAADIIQASKRHQKAELGAIYDRTTKLTTDLRAAVPAEEMQDVILSASNDALIGQLHALASARPALYDELRAWEEMLHGDRATASPPLGGQAVDSQPPAGEPPK